MEELDEGSVPELKTHERVQKNDKPFSCSRCEEKFVQETELNEHEQIHTSEKPFSCSQCEEKFENANGLKEHEMTHSSRLRVMSWNINRGISNSTKMAQILNTISEEEVDIMFLLETDKEEKNIASVTLPGS